MKMNNLVSIFVLYCCILSHAHAVEEVPVDTELQLLLDVSGSVNRSEYQLQLDGYASAFNQTALQQTILNGPLGSVAVQLIMWSGSTQQEVMIDWTLIDSADSATSFSEAIANLARPFSGWTAIGEAVNFGYSQFASNGYTGTKNIIDVSGDGNNNQGVSPEIARSRALANGVDTINGIVITTDFNVQQEYVDDVVGGDDAFVLVTTDFQKFQSAIDKKLIAEISGTVPVNAVRVSEPSNFFILLFAVFFLFLRNRYNNKVNNNE